MKEKVVIIIPTYNEAQVIKDTINQVFNTTQSIPNYDIHILVFDSQSEDNTYHIVNALKDTYPKLHLAKESHKSGLGNAYLQAMRYAMSILKADIIFEFDADGSHQPKYIAPMLEALKTADVAVGSRYVTDGAIPNDWAIHRKIFSVLGNLVARCLLHPKYKDYTSGFRATRTRVLKKVLPRQFLSSQYAYKLHLFWLLHRHGAKIVEVPIQFIDRVKGHSKLPANSIRDSLRVVFTLRLRTMHKYLKMCTVGLSGAVLQFISYNILCHQMSPFKATQIACLLAILSNYTLNSLYTFKGQNHKPYFYPKKMAVFFSYSMVMILLQSSWVHFTVAHFGRGRLIENLMLAVGIGLGSLLNYAVYDKVIWPKVNADMA